MFTVLFSMCFVYFCFVLSCRVFSPQDYVMFQFVVRQARAGEGRITRVLTHRLPVTADEQGFLQVKKGRKHERPALKF